MLKNSRERRSEERIPVEKINQKYKKMRFVVENQEEVIAEVLDISQSGISLRVPIPTFNIQHFEISLATMDNSIQIEDEIVSVRPIDENNSKVSVMFSSENKAQIQKILKS